MKKKDSSYARNFIGKKVKAVIERPIGSKHPKFDWLYEVNYGYVPDSMAPDGEEIDVYVLGIEEPLKEFEGTCIAIVQRDDDDDDKIILVPDGVVFSDDEILNLVNFQERFFNSSVVRF